MITHDLKPDGKDELVTNDNKEEFVGLYLNWLLVNTYFILDPRRISFLKLKFLCVLE